LADPLALMPGPSRSFDEYREEALAQLAAGESHQAFASFRWALEYPGTAAAESFPEALEVLAQIGEAIAGPELAGKVRAAAQMPLEPDRLYDLGYELIEHGLSGIAATVLARAHRLAPDNQEVLSELVCALEDRHLHDEACRLLRGRRAAVESDLILRYLLAFNAMMCADPAEARAALPRLQQSRDPTVRQLAKRLAGLLARYDAVAAVTALDRRDLRGWHCVTSGGLLLHLSPYGFDEGMNGRYAFTQDSVERCREGLERLALVGQALGLGWRSVFILPERASAILGHAAAEVFGVQAIPWPAGGASGPGLIVAYDLAKLDDATLESLASHGPGQLLFAHASPWTKGPAFAADVTTFLYQYNQSPWEERSIVDAATGTMRREPPLEGAPAELARQIIGATAEPATDRDALVALANAVRQLGGEHAAGALRTAGLRRDQGTSSPVPSSQFL